MGCGRRPARLAHPAECARGDERRKPVLSRNARGRSQRSLPSSARSCRDRFREPARRGVRRHAPRPGISRRSWRSPHPPRPETREAKTEPFRQRDRAVRREPDVERISHRTPAGKGRTIACPHRGGIIDHGFGKTGPHAVPGSRRQGRAIPCAIRRRKSPTVQTSPSISTSSTGPWASARRPQRSTVTETLMVQPPIAERLAVPPLLPSCK
jgi:hypothetical protein